LPLHSESFFFSFGAYHKHSKTVHLVLLDIFWGINDIDVMFRYSIVYKSIVGFDTLCVLEHAKACDLKYLSQKL